MSATPCRALIPALLLASGLVLLDRSSCPAAGAPEIVLRDGLVLPAGGRAGRSAFRVDPIEARIIQGDWAPPRAGDSVHWGATVDKTWTAAQANADGWFTNSALRGGYAHLSHTAASNEIVLLLAAGHSMVYVNGEPHAGDVYEYGNVIVPVALRAGRNDFLLAAGRGRLRARLSPPRQPVFLDTQDNTLPDLVADEANDVVGAIRVVNATDSRLENLQLTATAEGGRRVATPVPALLPMSVRKVGFRVRHSGRSSTNRIVVDLLLTGSLANHATLSDRGSVTLRLLKAEDTRKETFISEIDGSAQYYAIAPARPERKDRPARALVLSTHGASVEASGQAAAYAHKPWAHIVAPTNRRPYGFDWEDWGRLDALEVLELAQKRYHTDPALTYLTGHSMGGHGAWQLGATFPDRFAAIAPSAGWISFFSYAGGRKDDSTNAVRALFQRAANPSDTLLMASNYLHQGVYVLHGDADDNVPVSEARTMRRVLEGFHREFLYHEQPGAGHWWGNACVDWPPIFDLFSRRRIPDPASVRHVLFTTVNPGISSRCHWVSVEAQERALQASVIDIEWDPNKRAFKGRSQNIARLSIETAPLPPNKTFSLSLDGQSLTNLTAPAPGARLWLSRGEGQWSVIAAPAKSQKGSHRNGPFKEAFQHRMLFVYATRGDAKENAWAIAKARFDAEAFLYRGNGSVDILPDSAFSLRKTKDRGVVLYGNADNNSAWEPLLKDSPVQVRRDRIQIGAKSIQASNLACLFLRPRPDSDIASVAVVSGTGVEGLRLTDRPPYFLAGVAFPDCTVFGPETLSTGADGIRVAGFFGNDWTVEHGEFAWQDAPIASANASHATQP
ncbi:MAG: prolyl oligopeptidase family serine peptidase [Verrucomicrobia bacterium]|nr:prolyl oligopeptidase family serine peptidase [Verrucomicrobiota bacterium]MBI3870658.1 prolyl oligopeptidase family serine peptidase [Verrucomicrobiota bacterium]